MLYSQEFFDALKGTFTQVAIALMGSLIVVVHQPGIQIGLQGFHGLIQLSAESQAEKFIHYRPLEAFYETVGLRATHWSMAMLDVIQLQVELIGMTVSTAEFTAIVGQYRLDTQPVLPIKRQDIIAQFGLLGSVQEAEGKAAVGIHNGMQVDVGHPLEMPDEEGVLAKQLAGCVALHMPFAERRVVLLDKGNLFAAELNGFLAIFSSSLSQRS